MIGLIGVGINIVNITLQIYDISYAPPLKKNTEEGVSSAHGAGRPPRSLVIAAPARPKTRLKKSKRDGENWRRSQNWTNSAKLEAHRFKNEHVWPQLDLKVRRVQDWRESSSDVWSARGSTCIISLLADLFFALTCSLSIVYIHFCRSRGKR